MQIKQRIFNCTDMQIKHFILDKILKLLTYNTPFCHQSLQSYLISNTVRFFGPPCIYTTPFWHIVNRADDLRTRDSFVAVTVSNPTTNRLLSKLLADPDELITEPVLSTSQTVDARISLVMWKIVVMVCTSIFLGNAVPRSFFGTREGFRDLADLIPGLILEFWQMFTYVVFYVLLA